MKLNEQPFLPDATRDAVEQRNTLRIFELLRAAAIKVNQLASGSVSGLDGGATAAPAAGTWARGDFVRNAATAELGTAGGKYVLQGWDCVASGTPGTWVQRRTLTGN